MPFMGVDRIISSVVAHIDHGKTSLVDSLIAAQGRISKSLAGTLRFLDTREDEQRRGITLKLSAISLNYKTQNFVIIDTPGHVDFESLVQTSAMLSDNFLLLVDVNEGITPRTYSLVNYIKGKGCVLAINKIDKILTADELAEKVECITSALNGLIGRDIFSWDDDNVILCCSTLCYGFNKTKMENVLNRPTSLTVASKFLFHLNNKIDEGDIQNLCKRFNILSKGKKNILSAIFPLADCVFECLTGNYLALQASGAKIESVYEEAGKCETDQKERLKASTSSKNTEREALFLSSQLGDGDKMSCQTNLGQGVRSDVSSLCEVGCVQANTALPKDEPSLIKDLNCLITSDLVRLEKVGNDTPSVVGLTAYCILQDQKYYTKDQILFVVRLFRGTITTGDILYSANEKKTAQSIVEGIYRFGVGELMEVNSVCGPDLVCLVGSFQKNSLITDKLSHFIEIRNRITPFYKTKISLNDFEGNSDLKEVFRVIGYLEQCLSIKLNKFGEFEISCAGKVQSEKILADVDALGFQYSQVEVGDQFCECSSGVFCSNLNHQGLKIEVMVCKRRQEHTLLEEHAQSDSNNNMFLIETVEFKELVESVLEVLVMNGPLIKEKIRNTIFKIKIEGDASSSDTDQLYSLLKSFITTNYMESNPRIVPFYYFCKIAIQQEYIGQAYKSLSKFRYLLNREDYQESTGFTLIDAMVPQFMYSDFVDDLRISTKGTAYIILNTGEYVDKEDFSLLVDDIRKGKGLFTQEKIADESFKKKNFKK